MKVSMFICILGFLFYSCSTQNFIRVSEQIDKKCVSQRYKNGKAFNDLRIELYKKGKLNLINSNFDTLYIIEMHDIESNGYFSSIWNKDGALHYQYHAGKFEYDKESLFTKYTIQLIQKWDTIAIREEEKINATTIPERYLTGIMVIYERNGKEKVYCIKFKEFFNLERDQ